jgi:hypothetical protein
LYKISTQNAKLPLFGLFYNWHNNGKFGFTVMKLTNKDILLLLGVIVAVIITLTMIVYSERTPSPSTSQNEGRPSEKTSLNSSVITKEIIRMVDLNSRVSY